MTQRNESVGGAADAKRLQRQGEGLSEAGKIITGLAARLAVQGLQQRSTRQGSANDRLYIYMYVERKDIF